MGYLALLAAISCNAVKGYCGKKQSTYLNGAHDALVVNFLRMLFCAAVGIGILLVREGFVLPAFNSVAFPILILAGAANAAQVVFWMLSVQRNAVTLTDVFATLGLILPTVACSILFQEKVRLIQWAGYLLLCAAAVVMCSYNISLKNKKMSVVDFAYLVGFGLSIGAADLTQKLFINCCSEYSTNVYNFYTFLFAALTAVLLLPLFRKKPEAPPCPVKKVWIYIVLMATSLFFVVWGKAAAAAVLPAVQVYPLYQGGVLITMALIAAVFFGEKITRRCVIGMSMAFAAMLMMNVL